MQLIGCCSLAIISPKMHKERVFTLPSQGSKIQSVSVWVTLNMQVMARCFSDFDPAFIFPALPSAHIRHYGTFCEISMLCI